MEKPKGENKIVDYNVKKVGGQAILFFFRFGKCDDFRGTLNALKTAVPASFRDYNPETHIWTVDASFLDALCQIFDNFRSSYDTRAGQFELWVEGKRQTAKDSMAELFG